MALYKISASSIYVVGCGGVASYLLPVLIKLLAPLPVEERPVIHLFDGDKFEEKNIDRQLFAPAQVGMNKAEALADLYDPTGIMSSINPRFLTDSDTIEPNSLVIGCADNHAARKAILSLVDRFGGRAIIGGNEYTDAEAYFYQPDWKGGPLDPRVYYPDILTNERGDPTRPMSCQGMAATETPQLVLANFAAASQILWLLWFHYVERPTMDKEASFNVWPIRHFNTFSRFGTTLVQDKLPTKK